MKIVHTKIANFKLGDKTNYLNIHSTNQNLITARKNFQLN